MKSTFHHSSFSKKRQKALEKKAHSYTGRIVRLLKKNDYSVPESALMVARDEKYHASIKKSLARFKGVRHVVLVGIGGSSLGTEAVYQALAYTTSPELLILDSIEKNSIEKFETLLKNIHKSHELALVVVSKSGTTTETMTNAIKALEILEKKFGKDAVTQTIFIGDKNSDFLKIGKKKKVLCFTLPTEIQGRYSVFTAAGIVPLSLLGIDVISLREGAGDAISAKAFRQTEEEAVTLTLHAEKGVHTINFFTFNSRLELCGFWYRQLLAESIGKTMTTKGTTFSHQLLPIVSTSTDLHSMTELYLGGYKNIYTRFLYYDEAHPYHLLSKHWLLEHVPFLSGKSLNKISDAIRKGVVLAYDDQKLPYTYTVLPKCSAYEIGFMLASLMAEVMTLAHLMDVNAFNQPSVELYKKHTRKALGLK
jgi:glucose-6-phosphate isomerase